MNTKTSSKTDESNASHGYTIENGIIKNPGKFEGEARYAPYFFNLANEGMSDESFYRNYDDEGESDDLVAERFNLNGDDKSTFPELEEYSAVTLKYDSAGFVFVKPHKTIAEANQCIKDWIG